MKILIINKDLSIGGLEKSLINFIKFLNNDVCIDLMLLDKKGELLKDLPKNVTVLQGPDNIKPNKYKNPNKFKSFIKKILVNCGLINLKSLYLKRSFPKNLGLISDEQYDVAINFNGFDYIQNRLVLQHIKANKKICFIHNDVFKFKLPRIVTKQFKLFDLCLGCSKSCTSKLRLKYKLQNTDTIYNFQDINNIKTLSTEPCNILKTSKFCIGTVGRLGHQKAPLRLMKIINNLNKKKYDFDFIWVGSGPDYNKVQKYIKKHNISNVKLLGNQENPYKFIKKFDLFVLASYLEAAPMVYCESMTLKVPVLTTDTCSAKELVSDWGWVCKNNYNSIIKKLEYLIINKKLIYDCKTNLNYYKWNNEENKIKFLNLISNNISKENY